MRSFLIALAVLVRGLAAAEAPPVDWSAVLAPQVERPLLRQVVIERRADAWLVASRAEVLAALRAGTLSSSVAIYAAEVLLAQAELSYDEALDLHGFLWRTHHPRDPMLADLALYQWFSWLPPGVDIDAVHRRMVERGLPFTRDAVGAMMQAHTERHARQRAAGQPVAASRAVLVTPGSIYGQSAVLDGRLTVRNP